MFHLTRARSQTSAQGSSRQVTPARQDAADNQRVAYTSHPVNHAFRHGWARRIQAACYAREMPTRAWDAFAVDREESVLSWLR
jgi:hypothetical protein